MRVDRKSLAVALIMLVKNYPTNTPRVFHVETVVYFKVSYRKILFQNFIFKRRRDDVTVRSKLLTFYFSCSYFRVQTLIRTFTGCLKIVHYKKILKSNFINANLGNAKEKIGLQILKQVDLFGL